MFLKRPWVGALMAWASLAGVASADPLPGEVLKFQQLPMVATPVGGSLYYGHDELSTAVRSVTGAPTYTGVFMADDFADKVDSDIVHVRWWGSYLHQQQQPLGVKDFLVAFESDVPAGPSNPFSRPGDLLSAQILTAGPLAPGSGTFTEKLLRGPDPVLGEALYEYNGELKLPFHEAKDTVYWLKIVALVDPARDGALEWGWHNRDYTVMDPLASTAPAVSPGEFLRATLPSGEPVWHFQDDAVTGGVSVILAPGLVVDQSGYTPKNYLSPPDGPSIISEYSKDLAFELYYVPEPGTLALLAIGAGLLVLRPRRRK
ncbi:MAG: PEP-CTERM sorting domain-containing protein [Pirellulales bacterium]